MSYPPPPPLQPMYSADSSALRGASFGQAVQRFWTKYATFDGRASRSEFWYSVLFGVLVSIVFDVLELASNAFYFLAIIYVLAALVPNIAIGARRLHDIGKSGWWQLIALTCVGIIVLIVWFATAEKAEGDKYNV
ncbi:hypothetical protein Back2_18650 [Nocardioides baekrokdamisoli]|uniref:DUF805 domain-containing protein n=1 Tax=Nocardioides baekrokdamisoli TaxID=1804624 RepID=A0A3G9J1Z0_9ACTN|nr:DUF805 domain-containing protein [Nocardioides baekrokdamisoli]BBH17578.1 hypothetical protein Back2_18650 [Nocardioides baekrokdamisoli]